MQLDKDVAGLKKLAIDKIISFEGESISAEVSAIEGKASKAEEMALKKLKNLEKDLKKQKAK